MRLIFLGTPVFAVPTRQHLVQAGHRVLAAVTQPDRPRGRDSSPRHRRWRRRAAPRSPRYQPERIRCSDAVEHLRSLGAEAMVIVGYGQIIPQNVIDLARSASSMSMPRCSPGIAAPGRSSGPFSTGETRTGVTTMRIDAGLDTGDLLLKRETAIGADETAIELGARLAVMGAELLVATLAALQAGSLMPEKQDSSKATYAPLLKKEDGLIDWTLPAQAVHNRCRPQPWPGRLLRLPRRHAPPVAHPPRRSRPCR